MMTFLLSHQVTKLLSRIYFQNGKDLGFFSNFQQYVAYIAVLADIAPRGGKRLWG